MHGEREGLLTLFAQTEIFIFVFVEIVVNIPLVQRVILKRDSRWDKLIFILLFGGFSIMGTTLGIPLKDGIIANIRDFAPMLAGLIAGPTVGLGAGLIGGIERFFVGGITAVPCGIATILAGLIFGLIHRLNKGKLIGIIPAMGLGLLMELFHGIIAQLIIQPWGYIWETLLVAIPAMMIANSLGMGIGIILTSREIREHEIRDLCREHLTK